jgi:glucose-6-phosphate-specific signal transduction histidine kinase
MLGTIWLFSLVLIPIAVLSLLYGIKGGLVMGVLAFPVARLLFFLSHRPPLQGSVDIVMGMTVSIFFGLILGYLRDATLRYKRTSDELERAISEVRRLSGLLTICAHCNKIRDDEGYWRKVEDYLAVHSEVEFTHGLFPECMRELYTELKMEDEETTDFV